MKYVLNIENHPEFGVRMVLVNEAGEVLPYPDPVFEHRTRKDSAEDPVRKVFLSESGYRILAGSDYLEISGPFAKMKDALVACPGLVEINRDSGNVACLEMTADDLAGKLAYPEHIDLEEGQEFFVNDVLYTVCDSKFVPANEND